MQAERGLWPLQHLSGWAVEEQQRGGSLHHSGWFASDLLSTTLAEVWACCVQGGFAIVMEVRLDSIGSANVLAVLMTEVVEDGRFLLCFGCFWETHHCNFWTLRIPPFKYDGKHFGNMSICYSFRHCAESLYPWLCCSPAVRTFSLLC